MLTVLNAIKKLIPKSTNSIKKGSYIKNPNSTFGNGLGYTNKVQLIQNSVVHNFAEIGDHYFPEVLLELKGDSLPCEVFPAIFQIFQISVD